MLPTAAVTLKEMNCFNVVLCTIHYWANYCGLAYLRSGCMQFKPWSCCSLYLPKVCVDLSTFLTGIPFQIS